MRYPSEVIIYRPGFWQEIKFAWIQYLALAIPFLFILNGLRSFIFTNQVWKGLWRVFCAAVLSYKAISSLPFHPNSLCTLLCGTTAPAPPTPGSASSTSTNQNKTYVYR